MTTTSDDDPRTDPTQASATGEGAPCPADDPRLVTYFQPFYNLRSGRLQGMEALARRRATDDGPAETPAAFFASAGELGCMRRIDLHVLDDALGQMARWRAEGRQDHLIVSINLSWDLVGSPEFVADVAYALERHGMPGDRLLVDITTAMFRRMLASDEGALDRLHRLQEREIAFCIDGFTADDLDILDAAAGVPVDIITLHPRVLADDDAGHDALRRLAGQVQEVGLPVVAAGVETPEQLALVRDLEFEWAQGFLFGAPVQADRALETSPARLDLD